MNIVCWTSLKVFLNVPRTEEKLEKEHKMLILENRAVFWDGFGPDGQTNVNWVSNPQVDPGRAALGCVGGGAARISPSRRKKYQNICTNFYFVITFSLNYLNLA